MARKRYSVEQIVAKLTEAEKLEVAGVHGRAALQAPGDLRPDVLSLADQVRRVEGGRGAAAEGA